MSSETERELVNLRANEFCLDSNEIFDDDNETSYVNSLNESAESTKQHVDSSVLQSTPVNGPPPARTNHLPSAIKSSPIDKVRNITCAVLPKTQQKKNILSRLSSIAEKSFNSPRRLKQSPQDFINELNDQNNNTIETPESSQQNSPNSEMKQREAQCECNSCKDALALDTFSDRASEISCSLTSLSQSPRPMRNSTEKITVDGDIMETMTLCDEKLSVHRNTRISDSVHRLSRLLHSTVKAGRKSIGLPVNKSSYDSETSSSTVGAQSSKTSFDADSKSVKEGAFLSKCLKKLASSVSIHHHDRDKKAAASDENEYVGDDGQRSISNNSLMFVLVSPKPGEVEIDRPIWTDSTIHETQVVVRDPALRNVLEELRGIMLSQEVVVKQASKALDECSNLMRKASESIIFAEQLLHNASQSYFSAERELRRLLEGGVFEPQRDRVVIRRINFQLPDAAQRAHQAYLLVLLKSGHRIKASELICVAPGQQRLTVENWNRDVDEKCRTNDFAFQFNRPDWEIHIEVYCVGTKRRESLVSLNRLARFIDIRGPPSRHTGSSRSVEVRKSSFGLLARAVLSKEDILDRRRISLTNSEAYQSFEIPVFLQGQAFLYPTVLHEAYLIVKDFNGRFGLKGQMKTFSAKLSNQRLDFYQIYDSTDGKTEPQETISLYGISEDNVVQLHENSTYFYNFTLKLREGKDSWLHLCTNSHRDTSLWVEHLKRAVHEPCGIELQQAPH